MARLPFRTAFLWGSTGPADAASVFGSLANGTPAFSNPPDPATIQAGSQWEAGWASPAGAVIGSNQPAIEDSTAKDYVDSYFINYLQQIGVVEWDPSGETPYDKYSYVNGGLTTSDSQLYVSLVNGNTDSLSNGNSWSRLGDIIKGKSVAAAWVVFQGTGSPGNMQIFSSFNVSSVVKVGTGQYLINFINAFGDDGSGNGIYSFEGSAGTPNGVASIGGDNNLICGGGPIGTTAIRTPNQCQVFCWEANNAGSGGAEDSNMISVDFFSQ